MAISQENRYDAVVLLGFGGPAGPAEIRPFLDRVLQGRSIPASRYEEVVDHYLRIGGKSPYNELTHGQAEALRAILRERGIALPVNVALRNAAPLIEDVFHALARSGAQRLLGVILAAHQSAASWDRYVERAEEARRSLGTSAPDIDYTSPFFDHPLFVQAQAARAREAMARLGRETVDGAALIFTAHSIPQTIADSGPYVRQLRRSAELVASLLNAPSWTLAYQSRSGSPTEAWLDPDVRSVLRDLPQASGMREAVVVPLGFLCDHVEILYDLDMEAAQIAEASGIRMERAPALNDHPLFIEMLAQIVAERLRRARGETALCAHQPQ